MNRPHKIKFMILILTVFVGVVFLAKQSFAYFDKLQLSDRSSIPIGEWNNSPTKEKIIQQIKDNYPVDYHRFILDGLGIYDRPITGIQDVETLYNAFILSEKYLDYTSYEIETIIEEMWAMANDFLYIPDNLPPAYTVPSYPTNILDVDLVKIDEFNFLQSGQSKQVVKMINSANLSNIDNYYDPIILQVVINSKIPGKDVSDYVVEVLIDAKFLTEFTTGYIIYSDSSLSYPYISKNQFVVRNLSQYIIPNDTFDLLTAINIKYTSSSPLVSYFHNYPKPQMSGDWMRLPGAFRYDLVADSYWNYFPHLTSNNESGLVLNGRPDGVNTDLRILLAHRHTFTDVRTINIPITFILSRADGSHVDDNEIEVRYRIVASNNSHWDPNLKL